VIDAHLDLSGTAWRKSSHSGTAGNCVEVALTDPAIAVRDSKDPDGPTLAFGRRAWRGFTTDIKHGSHDPT
jgi:hypothetical protein